MTKSKINLNKEIIKLFSGQSSTLTIPKLYVKLTGSHSLGLVLNQAVFWSNKSECDNEFFYKTYEEWFEETHIPERTLRRRFDKLEYQGLITTKVRKIKGKNTKHVRPNIDKIIELISIILNSDCPIRPTCPDGVETEQNPCTNIAPTGHNGRSEPANLSVSEGSISLYTDDNFQKKTTNCKISSSSFFFNEILDRQMLNEKLCRDERSDEEFLTQVLDHVENHSDKTFSKIIRQQAALKLLRKTKKQNNIFYVKGISPSDSKPSSKSKLPEHHLDYEAYLSQFRNDKKLKLISYDAIALEYQEWVNKQLNNAKKSYSA